MINDRRKLIAFVGHDFADPDLLTAALTHRSARGDNNERLEFLGDAVLGFVIAAKLYVLSPEASEGELSRRRAALVNKATLAKVAQELALGDCLALGSGEMKSGGFRRASILADALEAVIGALYLDGGLPVAEAFIDRLFEARLATVVEAGAVKDAKTRLQERLQKFGVALPEYAVVNVEGAAHKRTFTVECRGGEPQVTARADGRSRRRAEQAAAAKILEILSDG